MGDKQKKGPSKPAKMSEHDWQEQLRAERRKPSALKIPDPIVKLVFVLTPKANKAHAYDSLEKSAVLQAHARRYKYHDPRQLTVMSGKLTVEVPQSVVNQLKRELTPGWKIENAITQEPSQLAEAHA